ncbi:MAG TPA: hypothetical protein VFW38_09140 [Solirubrobacteraceae bacterium]|nr:hypothetical protein [Solirubrobacteraceae bacterium]
MEEVRGSDAELTHGTATPVAATPPIAKQKAVGGTGSAAPTATGRVADRRGSALARADLILIAALVAVVAAIYSIYALRVGNFQNDEELYTLLARYIARHFPGAALQSGIFARGTQRLDQVLLALPFMLWQGPTAFQAAHVLQSALFASTALPVFLLARKAGLRRTPALFAATLSVVIPWAVVSTSFLTESAAYPAYAWVLYTSWLAARRPSPAHDGLVLLALIVAALSRTALLALAPLPVLAIVWQEWGWEMRHLQAARRARLLPRHLCSRHLVLTLSTLFVILGAIVWQSGLVGGHGLGALAGDYGLPQLQAPSALWARYREYLSRMIVGTGFLAVAVALPWLLATIVRPRSAGKHALAAVCTLGVPAVLLSLLQADADERYVLYAAAPIALATAAALSAWARAPRRGTLAVCGVLLGAAVVVAVIASVSWPGLTNNYDYFSFPAAIFFERVLVGHASLLHLPLLSAQGRLCAAVVFVALAFALVGSASRAARPATALLGIGLLALCGAQAFYSLDKFTKTAGEANGPSAAERSWVDRHVPGNALVGELGVSMGATSDYVPIWRTTNFWNTSVQAAMFVNTKGNIPLPLGIEPRPMRIQAGSGLLSASNHGHPAPSPTLVPHYLLLPRQGTNALGLDAQVVAQDPYLPLELVRLAQPAHVDWSLHGTSPEGFLTPGTDVIATVYSGALTGGRCAKFTLQAPPSFSGRWPYQVRGAGSLLAHGSLAAQQAVSISVPLSTHVGAQGLPSASMRVTVNGGEVAIEGTNVSTKLAFFEVVPCAGRRRPS